METVDATSPFYKAGTRLRSAGGGAGDADSGGRVFAAGARTDGGDACGVGVLFGGFILVRTFVDPYHTCAVDGTYAGCLAAQN